MAKEKIRVLYLDDEQENLSAFKAGFRREFDVQVANNSKEAFDLIQSVRPHVIFSDQRMPEMTGVEFFNAVRQIYPEGIRILLTAFTDVKDIVAAINRGNVYRFVSKPWNEDELRNTVLNAYEIFNTRHELQLKVAELEKANEDLNRFIYSASHDLRAPLMSILGVVKLARYEEIDEPSRQYFGMIESSVNKLDLFIQNIIEYYQNSRDLSEVREIDFEQLVDDILENLRFHSANPKLRFHTEIQAPGTFKADEFRLRIILSNLISNAIRFQRPEHPSPEVRIKVSCNDKRAEILIEDNGIGILQEHMQNIFKMFFKAHPQHSGSGIGLYIVKEALNKVEGDISVSSTPNVGTLFSISIPNRA